MGRLDLNKPLRFRGEETNKNWSDIVFLTSLKSRGNVDLLFKYTDKTTGNESFIKTTTNGFLNPRETPHIYDIINEPEKTVLYFFTTEGTFNTHCSAPYRDFNVVEIGFDNTKKPASFYRMIIEGDKITVEMIGKKEAS